MRITFQEELEQLQADLHEEGDLILRSLRGALNALQQRDVERAEEMIRVAMTSFADRDLAGAEGLVDLDELIDRANRRVVEHVLQLGNDPELREWGLRMIVVSRCLERIGDHAVDIGEQTAYLITGEVREFTDASHPDSRP